MLGLTCLHRVGRGKININSQKHDSLNTVIFLEHTVPSLNFRSNDFLCKFPDDVHNFQSCYCSVDAATISPKCVKTNGGVEEDR